MNNNKFKNFKYWFGWPAPFQAKHNFFSSKNLSYEEVKRVIENIKNCSQHTWETKHYNILKDKLYLNENNSKLKKLIFDLL